MAALFGRRLRRGATTTAVAAAAIAALSASQPPGVVPPPANGGGQAAESTTSVPDAGADTATGNSQYYTDLPPLDSPNPSTTPVVTGTTPGSSESGIPATVLAAYKHAEKELGTSHPECNLPWQLLAAIGKVESGQARGGEVDANGTTLRPILGPVLDGVGFANITDTDDGLYDQDKIHDRAVGPMQFIPATWKTWGSDGNGDGIKDPNNIYDAALGAGLKLCAGHHDLSRQADMNAAILGYNQSQAYLNLVMSWFEYYKKGSHSVPDGTGTLPTGPGPLDPEPSTSGSPSPSNSPSAHPKSSGHSGGTGSTKPPGKPDTGSHPTKPPTDDGTTPPPTPPAAVVEKLVKADGDALSASAGTLFGGHSEIHAVDAKGKAVAKVSVTFSITGDTDARFQGGSATAKVTTGKDGVANAPTVQAGDKVGPFTVRATATGVTAVEFKATVSPYAADTLVRVGTEDLTAAPDAVFANDIVVKGTLAGTAAGKVAVTAEVLNADGTTPAAADGPSFKTADDKLTQTLTGVITTSDGSLTLPDLVAGKAEGTYLIRVTAVGGGTVTVTVKVSAPTEPSGDPTESPSPSPSA